MSLTIHSDSHGALWGTVSRVLTGPAAGVVKFVLQFAPHDGGLTEEQAEEIAGVVAVRIQEIVKEEKDRIDNGLGPLTWFCPECGQRYVIRDLGEDIPCCGGACAESGNKVPLRRVMAPDLPEQTGGSAVPEPPASPPAPVPRSNPNPPDRFRHVPDRPGPPPGDPQADRSTFSQTEGWTSKKPPGFGE